MLLLTITCLILSLMFPDAGWAKWWAAWAAECPELGASQESHPPLWRVSYRSSFNYTAKTIAAYNPLKGQGSDFFPPSLPQNWECCGKIKGQFFWVWRYPLEHNITHACTHVRTRSWQLGLLFEPKTSFLLMSYWLFSRPVSSWLSRCRPATPTWWSSSGGRCRAGAGPFHLRRAATHHSNIPQHQDSRGSNWKILSACKVLSYCLYFGMLFPIKIISV